MRSADRGGENGWSLWGTAVGESLRDRGISVNAAATRLGLRNNTLQSWLKGAAPPRLSSLPDIAEMTGLTHAFQLELGGVLPDALRPEAHSVQVAEELRLAVGRVRDLVVRASEIAYTDVGARLAGILLSSEAAKLQVSLRRAYRGHNHTLHLSTYVGIQSIESEVLTDQMLRERVMQIVGESASLFGARWREQTAHDWPEPRPELILNVPQHERTRPPAEAVLTGTPNILMLGCPYAHAEYVGALIAESLAYGYHDVRYSVPLPLDKSPTDLSVTEARTAFARRLAASEDLTRHYVWSIADHRVIPQILGDLPGSAVGCAVYVRSGDALLRRGSEVWNVPHDEMLTLRQSLDSLVSEAPWPAVVVELPDELVQDETDGVVDRDMVADAAMLAAADVWKSLARRGRAPRGEKALGRLRQMFADDGRLRDMRPSLIKQELRF